MNTRNDEKETRGKKKGFGNFNRRLSKWQLRRERRGIAAAANGGIQRRTTIRRLGAPPNPSSVPITSSILAAVHANWIWRRTGALSSFARTVRIECRATGNGPLCTPEDNDHHVGDRGELNDLGHLPIFLFFFWWIRTRIYLLAVVGSGQFGRW